MKMLEAWNVKSLRCILGVTWRDRLTYQEIYRRTNCCSLESLLGRRQLRWIGHVIRMDDDRLPKQILYGELSTGRRKAGGQKKRHKDLIKTVLNKFDIAPDMLESFAADRGDWRNKCYEGAGSCERKRNERMRLRRERRHQRDQNVAPEDVGFPCHICDRVCRAYIGHQSHLRAHQRRGEDGTVVVAPDGPP